MTFINVKTFKTAISLIAKISDQYTALHLSKDSELSFRTWFGSNGWVSLPVESSTIKERSKTASKSVTVSTALLAKIVRQLPILLEEIEIEFAPPGLIISGEYGTKGKDQPLYSYRYELGNCSYFPDGECDMTEEKVIEFQVGAEIAIVLSNAATLAQKSSYSMWDNVFLACKEDEILITGTDGHQLMQKYVYTKEMLTQNIDFVVSSELGLAIGKFAFEIAHFDIYQNFVKVTLDDSIEIFAVRPLTPEKFPDFEKWDDKAHHTTLVVDINELKSRLNKLGKDVWIWLYVENDGRLAIECFEGDSVGVSWIKNTLKTPPALIVLNSKRLLQTLKTAKKTTTQIRLMLPKLVAESEFDDFLNGINDDRRNVAFLEFDKNSHLIAGHKKEKLRTPPGIRNWLIAQGWSILPESKPVSTAAKSVVKILSDRWTGKGWEKPELVACGCGTIHDESDLKPQLKKVKGYCDHCEDYREIALYQIDYRCINPTCNTLNRAMVDRPLPVPICMNCGKDEFTTQHHFECCDCERPVTVNNCKVCPCDTILEEDAAMWQCSVCESTFFVDDICDEEDLQYIQETEADDAIFVGCPCCERFDVELTSSQMHSCHECGSITHDSFYVPAIEAPSLPCPDCNEDLSDVPPQKINDPFVVGSVTRF
jgi:hypothetical protein